MMMSKKSYIIHSNIYMHETQAPSASNASRTSERRVSCLGMSWRRNKLITVTLPKSRVARTVCYVNCFVQTTANTKTCLPINNHGEYRKSPFNLFSAPANRRKSLHKRKSLRRITKGAIFIFPTRLRRIRHKDANIFFSPTVKRKAATKKRPAAKKVLSAQNRLLC